jgi:7-cyano-7-deazaguanine synthase
MKERSQADGIAIVSGGLDSITMVYYLLEHGFTPRLMSFDYGQRHVKELQYALQCAERLGLQWSLVDLSSVTELIGTSALTYGQDVPEGHYAEDNMAITVVPNRNMMMLSIATAAAVSAQLKYVAAGMHAGDHAQYPDCRPNFLAEMTKAAHLGNEGFIDKDFYIRTPFINATKNDIAQHAYTLGVPLDQTWSCYRGSVYHCGRCGTCCERLEAIDSVKDAPPNWDLTKYEDTTFWRQAVADYERKQRASKS